RSRSSSSPRSRPSDCRTACPTPTSITRPASPPAGRMRPDSGRLSPAFSPSGPDLPFRTTVFIFIPPSCQQGEKPLEIPGVRHGGMRPPASRHPASGGGGVTRRGVAARPTSYSRPTSPHAPAEDMDPDDLLKMLDLDGKPPDKP